MCSFCGLPSPFPLLVAAIICVPANYRIVHLVILLLAYIIFAILKYLHLSTIFHHSEQRCCISVAKNIPNCADLSFSSTFRYKFNCESSHLFCKEGSRECTSVHDVRLQFTPVDPNLHNFSEIESVISFFSQENLSLQLRGTLPRVSFVNLLPRKCLASNRDFQKENISL